MAFNIPTLSTLIDRITGDINASMRNQNASIRRTLAYAFAHAMAGIAWGLYLYHTYIYRQVFPDTADSAQLSRWARLFSIIRDPAVKASGTLTFTGTAGSDLLGGSVLQRQDGREYVVVGDYHWTASEDKAVTVQASVAGVDGNQTWVTGMTLELVSPPAGVVASGVLVHPGLTGGADVESDPALLVRLLGRLGNPPQGGARSDYDTWARSTTGVRPDLVWIQGFRQGVTLGQVRTLFTIVDTGDDGTVIPSAGNVAAVLANIEPLAPVDVEPLVVAPGGQTTTITVTAKLLAGASQATVLANIRRGVQLQFRARAATAFSHEGWAVPNSDIRDGIDAAAGIDWYTLDDVNGGAATDDVVLASNEYPVITDADVTLIPVE